MHLSSAAIALATMGRRALLHMEVVASVKASGMGDANRAHISYYADYAHVTAAGNERHSALKICASCG